jgi:hypothetical protein
MLLIGCVLGVLLFTSYRRRIDMAELGTVSEQWLSEHRGYDQRYLRG